MSKLITRNTFDQSISDKDLVLILIERANKEIRTNLILTRSAKTRNTVIEKLRMKQKELYGELTHIKKINKTISIDRKKQIDELLEDMKIFKKKITAY